MIWIDHRERQSNLPKIFDECGIAYAIRQLEVGDVLVDDIPIEHKEIGDYLDSLTSKRLNNQLFNLSNSAPLSYLIVVGHYTDVLLDTNISPETYHSSLIGSSFRRSPTGCRGIVVTVNVDTIYGLAWCVKSLEKKSADGRPRLPEFKAVKWGRRDQVQHLIASIPGIGLTRAGSLLRHFKSVRAIATATRKQLEQIDGIGPQISLDVYETFNLEV